MNTPKYIDITVTLMLIIVNLCTCSRTPQNDLLYNPMLSHDAENNINYSGYYFKVLVDSAVQLFVMEEKELIAIDSSLLRGNVFSVVLDAPLHSGFILIELPNKKKYFIKNRTKYFSQEFDGMRYPLFGIVDQNNCFITCYNEIESKNETVSIEKGTVYLYVLTKDKSYINLLHPKYKTYITGEFCCKVSIIQLEDHLAIMKKYKTRLNNIFHSGS
ncbi:MAG: hypothetical protein ACKV1O_10775 [Saprospiraceae bacterium]